MVIKKASLEFRTISMFLAVIVMLVLFTFWFEWFPTDKWQPWCMFFVCFSVSTAASTMVSILYERGENRKMDEALCKLKQEQTK